jgi:hypothetical protein
MRASVSIMTRPGRFLIGGSGPSVAANAPDGEGLLDVSLDLQAFSGR